MWKNIDPAPPDAILGLTEAFKKDRNPNKVNLGVGIYKADNGRTPVLESVREAERRILDAGEEKTYLPITGSEAYGEAVRGLLFGENAGAMSERAVTAHAPGGTGALRLGADLLQRFRSASTVWVSDPTWANHHGIFAAAGFEIQSYPYYDRENSRLDFDAMLAALKDVPANDIVLLHVCCHNPTGEDLSPEQWEALAAAACEKGWIPFLDFAYQGFAEGLEADRRGVRAMAEAGPDCLIAGSFSKNFGLYCERAGSLTLTAHTADDAATAESHLKKTARVLYSNPPAHGARIVTTILDDPTLAAQWKEELAGMRRRIHAMRRQLADGLRSRDVPLECDHFERQQGMFSFSGLNGEQVDFLRDEKSIYIVRSGRINVSGLTADNIDYVCESIAEAVKTR
ncbi:amino acid aminotransferase [Kiritimatiella glycovorans]|uniref:amino acid aminotransferase n=1 Tax=Kiritimatiella glycovorans TaxID=1307763 RepID=UPI00069A2DBA